MKHNVETQIILDKFCPRDYQEELWDAIENEGYRKVLWVAPRRAGKDLTCWNLAIRQCMRKVCLVYHCLPTYGQARKAVWDAIDSSGNSFLSYIPKEAIEAVNQSDMKIRFKNGSILQLIGADSYNTSLVGTNPFMIIFSEYSRMAEGSLAYQFAAPILAANKGIFIAITTPFGRNHAYHLFQAARELNDWYVIYQKTSEINHIDEEELASIRETMSHELYLQEFECDWNRGIEGAVFGKELEYLRQHNQITHVPWESTLLTHVAIDIGVSDATTIIWFQVIGEGIQIRIIDCHSVNNQGLDHVAEIIQRKPYRYGKYFAPHDLMVREWGGGAITRFEKARQLDINFTILDQIDVEDGIDNVKAKFPKFWIDGSKCKALISALENYRREWDEEKQIHKRIIHNWASHYCFIGETLIQLENKQIPVKEVKEGMFVRTPFGMRRVLKVHKRYVDELCDINVGNTKITCTPQHQIFTTRGLLSADSLRYNDVMEFYTETSGRLWKMIYGYYSKRVALEGFKKTILSLKTETRSSIMHMLIDGMDSIIKEEEQSLIKPVVYIEPSGNSIMGQFLESCMSTIKTMTNAIMSSRILNLLNSPITADTTCCCLVRGLNQKKTDINCSIETNQQKLGIQVLRESNGINSMQRTRFPCCEEQNMKENASGVRNNINQRQNGLSSVLMHVKRKIDLIKNWIIKKEIALSAMFYSFVINTLLKKHAVKNVLVYQLRQQEEVFDLTIEDDNCYYANGYLVSNSDALRYLCQSIHKTKKGMSSEEFEKKKAEALYGGNSNLPRVFDDRFNNLR